MTTSEDFERLQLAFHADDAVEVGVEDQQAALGDVLVEMYAQRAVVALAKVRGLSVEVFE